MSPNTLKQNAGPKADTKQKAAHAKYGRPQKLPLERAFDVLNVALFFGLAAGIVEAGFWEYRYQVLGKLTHLPQGFVWMTPLAYVALLYAAGLPLALVASRMHRTNVFGAAVALLLAFTAFNLLLLVPGLHVLAQLLLSLGIGAAGARLIDKRREAFLKLARRGIMVLGVSAAIVAAVYAAQGSRRFGSDAPASTPASSQVAQSPPAQPAAASSRAPNVLLIVLDTVRADALECYGGPPDTMPFLNGLARQGVVFDQAYATASWTLPSTAGMLTGRLPHELSADWETPLDTSTPRLAERLSADGYATGAMVGNTRYCAAETGLARGFNDFDDFTGTWQDLAVCTALGRWFFLSTLAPQLGFDDFPARKSAADVNREALAWLPERPQRPWFLFLNYFDAHHPYLPPRPFDKHPPRSAEERVAFCHWWWLHKENTDPAQVKYYNQAYDDCLRYMDYELETLLAELRHRGALENTYVIVTADHGEHFGDHGLYLHGNSLYQPLIHVPLIVVPPLRAEQEQLAKQNADQDSAGQSTPAEPLEQGRHVSRPVSLRSLPATVCELAGVDHHGVFPGRSLVRYWSSSGQDDKPLDEDPVIAEILTPPGGDFPCHGRSPVRSGPMQAIVSGRFKYIHNGDGSEQLFDLTDDPQERNNLAGDVSRQSTLQTLRGQLEHAIGTEMERGTGSTAKADEPLTDGEGESRERESRRRKGTAYEAKKENR